MDLMVLEDVVLPIFICVILPVSIVLIVFICRNRALAKKTDVIKLAIEKGADLDVDKMMEALSKTSHKADKPVSQLLLERLVTGIVLFLSGIAILLVWLLEDGMFFLLSGMIIWIIGVGYIVYFIVGRKMLSGKADAEKPSENNA